MSESDSASLPCLAVSGENVPEAWEKAVLAVYHSGTPVKTEYDAPDDPPSLDATVVVEVKKPLGEPRIHKNFPGGPVELEIYRREVLDGIHDHWINPEEGKWTYTYHQRLFAYAPLSAATGGAEEPRKTSESPFGPLDQIGKMIEKLSQAAYSRRAQAITWIPHMDPFTDDPPCLQRIWARLLEGEAGDMVLNLNTHWRSRDLYKAWFMNVFALTDMQRWMADRIAERIGRTVRCGRYVDICDSLHIYGSYRSESLDNEIAKMQSSPYTDRAWDSSVLEPIFREVGENLDRDPDHYSKGG